MIHTSKRLINVMQCKVISRQKCIFDSNMVNILLFSCKQLFIWIDYSNCCKHNDVTFLDIFLPGSFCFRLYNWFHHLI